MQASESLIHSSVEYGFADGFESYLESQDLAPQLGFELRAPLFGSTVYADFNSFSTIAANRSTSFNVL